MFCCFKTKKNDVINDILTIYHCETCNFESRDKSLVNKHKKICLRKKKISIYDDDIHLQRYQNL